MTLAETERPADGDEQRTNRTRRFAQKCLQVVGYSMGGLIATGAILDSIGAARGLVTPALTWTVTGLIALFLIAGEVSLRAWPMPWIRQGRPYRRCSLGRMVWCGCLGAIALVWLPRLPTAEEASRGTEPQEADEIYDGRVWITSVDLLDSTPEKFPYEGSVSQRFAIRGKDTLNVNRKKFGLLIFSSYMGQDHPRFLWFVQTKQTRHGFRYPNWLRLDSLDPAGWSFYTSSFRFDEDARPRATFRALVLPVETIEERLRELSDSARGWGLESLAALVDEENAFASEQFVLE